MKIRLPKYFGPEKQNAVWNRLRDRLTGLEIGETGFKVDGHVASIAHTIMKMQAEKGKKSSLGFKAREHYLLMMVSSPTEYLLLNCLAGPSF